VIIVLIYHPDGNATQKFEHHAPEEVLFQFMIAAMTPDKIPVQQ
jgi:hypothetical protein